jgi:two-component system response regulator HydG
MSEQMIEADGVKCANRSNTPANVLIAANDPQMVPLVLEVLARKGIRADLAEHKDAAVDFLQRVDYDFALISDSLARKDSLQPAPEHASDLLRTIRTNSPEMPVVMVAQLQASQDNAQLVVDAALRAVHAGCCDFLLQPLNRKKIEHILDTYLPNRSVSTIASADDQTRTLYTIVGKSPKLMQTVQLAEKIAPTSTPVLICGESGTGKELISFLVHHKSKRAHGPYLRVNCSALSDTLLESELFGHERGAFTGAHTQRKGRFEMAHGGTLLLDEITETPLFFQSKLLRVLEQQDFERVGGNESISVNVRIISTTNKDLLAQVQTGRFRQDLYYRLNGVRLVLAPLRQRTEDLPELVWHFVNLYAREAQRRITKLDPAMMEIFAGYSWPGNVRQLRNVVRTSLILGTGPTLSLADVSWLFDELQPLPQRQADDLPENYQNASLPNAQTSGLGGVSLEKLERQAILDTLRQTSGNQVKAAKVLGISDRTLRDKIRRYRQQGCLQSA